jgi:hypothetical protein
MSGPTNRGAAEEEPHCGHPCDHCAPGAEGGRVAAGERQLLVWCSVLCSKGGSCKAAAVCRQSMLQGTLLQEC